MAVATWQYRYFIAAPAAQIYAHLVEPTSYIGLSPLVISVADITTGTDGDGRDFCRYVSVERFHFLKWITYDNPIRVTTTFTQPDREMISEVDSRPGVHVQFIFQFDPDSTGTTAGTWVKETITATTPSVLLNFTVSQAKAVQQARSGILKTRLEPLAAALTAGAGR
ncbi:MAG TPA: hypothetical protein VHL11_12755 [Phototrophicaceae bacterium]|jgi:hypothetical protein|nr:hypothetical protein [Phototrophicaceae bacterium]